MYEKKRGRDLLPSDMIRFRHVERVFREEAIRFGYQEIRTPTIEPLSLFTSAGTLDPRMLDDLYSFLDWDGWSGERVVLRPEGTIPTGRLFLEHLSDKISARLFYISNMFSYDEAGTSEHWQCGGELIERENKNKAKSDTEVLTLCFSVLKKMGFESPHFRIGYPPLVREILKLRGFRPTRWTRYWGSSPTGTWRG
jgi:histidyl-tRNA synthetase